MATMFWWYNLDTSETRDAHLPHNSAGLWGAKSTTGNRWNEDQNRMVSDLFDPHRTAGPKPPVRAWKQDATQPARPFPFRLEPEVRQAKMKKRLVQYGNCAPTQENQAVWNQMVMPICLKGRGLWGEAYPGATLCDRPAIETGSYCDAHSCMAIGSDGWRCPNEVYAPTISRYCQQGYHAENNRTADLEQAILRRAEQVAAEQAAQEAEDEEKRRAVAFPEIDVNDYLQLPTPDMVHPSLDTSQASSTSTPNLIRTPILDSSELQHIEAWWKRPSPIPTISSPLAESKAAPVPAPASPPNTSTSSTLVEVGLTRTTSQQPTVRTRTKLPRTQSQPLITLAPEVKLPRNHSQPLIRSTTTPTRPQRAQVPRDTGLGLNLGVPTDAGPSRRPLSIVVEETAPETPPKTGRSLGKIVGGFAKPVEAEVPGKRSPLAQNKYAVLMRERFDNGYVRKQAWGRNNSPV